MIPQSIQRLKAQQWCWIWSAYWRLWGAQLRIKLKQGSWIHSKVVTARSGAPDKTSLEPDVTQKIALMHESVRLAARCHFWQTACLPRSIVLADLLVSQGYSALVRLGVKKLSAGLSSHAWVEVEGVMVGEPESVDNDFTTIDLG